MGCNEKRYDINVELKNGPRTPLISAKVLNASTDASNSTVK
jgi:hypothetical protein